MAHTGAGLAVQLLANRASIGCGTERSSGSRADALGIALKEQRGYPLHARTHIEKLAKSPAPLGHHFEKG